MTLEELAECGLVGETEFFGHVLYGISRIEEADFGLFHQAFIDELVGRFVVGLSQFGRQGVGRHKKLVGIPFHCVMKAAVGMHQVKKAGKRIVPWEDGLFFAFLFIGTENDVLDFQYQGTERVLQNFMLKIVFCLCKGVPQDIEQDTDTGDVVFL